MGSDAETDHAPGLDHLFSTTPGEGHVAVSRVEGELPSFLRGVYYVNGPARFSRGTVRYRHWLDGDGMAARLCFPGGGGADAADLATATPPRLTRRFVRSHKLVAEEAAGEPLYRAFGTAFDGDQLVRGIGLASPVNVSIVPFAGLLLACGEQGRPWRLDPETLETLGEHDFDGGLGALAPFSAHAKVDPSSGELFNFGVSYAAGQPVLNVYRFAADGAAIYRRRLPLPYPASIHDFALSPSYVVFHVSPYLLDMAALAGGATVLAALAWQPHLGSQLLVVRREDGSHVATVPLAGGYCLHTINACEPAATAGPAGPLRPLEVDILELERPVYDQYQELPHLFRDVAPGGPVRLVVDPDSGTLLSRVEIPYRLAPDFPAIDPRLAGQPYRDLWMLGISAAGRPGRKFFDELVHADWEATERNAGSSALDIHREPAGCYLGGEPVFVPDPAASPAAPGGDARGGAGAGVILCQRFDATRNASSFLVFDAQAVAAGPRAILHLASPHPPGFHAVFVAATTPWTIP